MEGIRGFICACVSGRDLGNKIMGYFTYLDLLIKRPVKRSNS